MRKIAVLGPAIGALLIVPGVVSAQDLVRPRWNAYGSPVCPRNYDYLGGWCRPVYGGYREPDGYPRSFGRYGGDVVPPRWTPSGSAVCPTNYEYDVRINACVSVISGGYREPDGYRRGFGRYGGDVVPPRWTPSGSAVCPTNYDYDARIGACVYLY
jgi:hypothetical protein